jgi:hypothetical protein
MAVALPFHGGAHLDNIQRALPLDIVLQGLHCLVLAGLAYWAASRTRAAPPLHGEAVPT